MLVTRITPQLGAPRFARLRLMIETVVIGNGVGSLTALMQIARNELRACCENFSPVHAGPFLICGYAHF